MKKFFYFTKVLSILLALLLCSGVNRPLHIHAANQSMTVNGRVITITDNNYYSYTKKTKFSKASNKNSMGKLKLSGQLFEDSSHDNGFTCDTGNVSFSYSINKKKLTSKKDQWHIIPNKTKKLNNIDLKKNANLGALVIQSSRDGEHWVVDSIKTDIFKNTKKFSKPIYETNNIQLNNGNYFRIFIAYTLEKTTGQNNYILFKTDKKESKHIVEEYNFYISGNQENNVTIETTPKKEFSNIINTGKDNGYSDNIPITNEDPHFNWNIGYFTINGYTRETTYDGSPIYLKNHGDKVTLWFTLTQDINCINGNPSLTISEDVNASDQSFRIKNKNFKHGTLLIRHTDETGKQKDPIIYTDFLAANATTTAETKVQLFEEGDYDVSLNYEVEQTSGPGSIIKDYYNYKIAFSFKIRNGNSMIFPLDTKTGKELSNESFTENGFKLDLVQSKYLTIDVQKSILKEGKNKSLIEDVRFNRPAKNGESYDEEGIYTITVKNLYTDNDSITKTIYVGTNKYIKALSQYNLTVAELNDEIKNGAKVKEDGTLTHTELEKSK